MFGFTTLSESALSEAVLEVESSATLQSVSATLSAGQLSETLTANKTIASVSSTFNLGIEFDAKANTTLSSVAATSAINGFASVTSEASPTLSAATATSSAGTLSPTAIATFTIASVSASTAINSFSDVDAKANITLSANSISTNVNTVSVTVFDEITLSSVLSTSSVNSVTTIAKANTTVTPVTAEINLNDLSPKAIANKTISSVSATFGLGIEFDAKANTTLSSVSTSTSVNEVATTAVVFDYNQFKDSYDRRRVIYADTRASKDLLLISAPTKRTTEKYTVHIPSDLRGRTVYIAPINRDNTIRIAA